MCACMREDGHGDAYAQTCTQIGYTRLGLCVDGCARAWGWVGWMGGRGWACACGLAYSRWVGGMGICVRVDIVSNLDTVGCEMDLRCVDGPAYVRMGLHVDGLVCRWACMQMGLRADRPTCRWACVQMGLHADGPVCRWACVPMGLRADGPAC